MANVPFFYAPMFQLGEDKTEYRLISKDGVSMSEFEGHPILKVSKEALELLTTQAFHDVNFMLRREHNEKVAAILNSPEASDNDKFVALTMLRNAEVACKGQLPFCHSRVILIHIRAYYQAEYRIAEKFQPLVAVPMSPFTVLISVRRMRKRSFEQRYVTEAVS